MDASLSGLSGLDMALTNIYDAIILDVMLPGKNGFEIAKEVRKQGIRTPILMLTAKSELDDKVSGLDSGADDYLTKPFETKELFARLRALLRRNCLDNMNEHGELIMENIALNQSNSTVRNLLNGQSVRLSEKELHIMEYLMINFGHILSKEQLAVKIWGFDNEAEYNNVEVYISFTRKKLQFISADLEIKEVRGIGYELRKKTT